MNRMPPLASVLRRNFLNGLATFAAVMGASFLYLKVTPPVYESSARLILDDRRTSVSELGQALAANPAPGNANPIATQAELLTSERVLKQAALLLAQQNPAAKSPTAGEMSGALKVKIVPATNILELNYKSSNPQIVAAVPNAIVQAMVKESGESIRQEASSVRQFVEARVPQQERNLARAELAESQYKEANGIVSLEAQDNSLIGSLTAVEDQVRTLSAQLQEADRKTGQLQSIIGTNNVQSAYLASRAGQDDELKTLRGKLTELETQVIEARSRLGDRHPDLLALVQKRDETRTLYGQSLSRVVPNRSDVSEGKVAADDLSRTLISTYITGEVERNALINKLNALQQQQEPLRARLSELPAKQRVLSTLVRQRAQEEATLKLLQTKLEEARIAEAQLVSNVRIIGLANAPSSPSSPKMVPTLLLGAVAGLVAAIGVVLLGEMLNNKIGSAGEIESQLKLPLLGVLPDRRPIHPGQIERFLDNPAAIEPYRRLLKTLELNSKEQLKSILVSSSIAGEGKATVAAHLSMVAALLSHRTLLIDADLSFPLQDYFFNLPPQPGLTDAVSDNVPLLSVVQPTGVAGLDVLTQGRSLDRPAQVLEAAAMKSLMINAIAYYDLVILSTSPISRYVDTMTLSEHTDGVVLVVRPEASPKGKVQQTIADLQRSGSSILGLVATATPDPTKIDRTNPTDKPDSIKGLLTRKSLRSPA
jgi:polysaccharide biosynthesis transport protein